MYFVTKFFQLDYIHVRFVLLDTYLGGFFSCVTPHIFLFFEANLKDEYTKSKRERKSEDFMSKIRVASWRQEEHPLIIAH